MSAAGAGKLVLVRAAMRQVRAYLNAQGITSQAERGDKKRKDMIRLFLEMKGYSRPVNQSLYDRLIEIWQSGEDPDVTLMGDGFYNSKSWKKLRRKVLHHYGRVCMACGAADEPTVDHVKPRSLFPNLALDFDNMQVLCQPCNSAKSNRSETDYRVSAAR